MTACDQCGYVYEDHGAGEIPAALRHTAREVRDRLGHTLEGAGGLERLRLRPAPEVWSPLEYAGHIRDVLFTQRERFFRTLVEDNPSHNPMYRDERVQLGHYNDEDPTATGTEVTIAADLLARLMNAMDEASWARPCVYNNPNPTQVTLLWVGQHTLHEAVHHLGDIDAQLQPGS